MKKLFSKLLSKTDIQKRLAIPTESLGLFAGDEAARDLEVEDKSGKVWQFRCSVRKGRYRKPVFAGGWCNFVRFYGLSVGDEVMLYKVKEGDSKYKIKARKVIKIFGVTFGFSSA